MVDPERPATRTIHTVGPCGWDGGRSPVAAALFWGGSLITIGAVLLLIEAGVVSDFAHNLLWPGFLIVLGAWILTSPVARAGGAGDESWGGDRRS